ncbi:MAG: TetR/AcrR family transcriptional regulator, partial [Gammaproteobacteria bacterium]
DHIDTRTSILETAKKLFADHGYGGVSVRDIASVCGIKAPSLYHHFPDKQTLYLATMEYAFADKAAEIVSAVGREGTPKERLSDFVERFTCLMAADPEFRRLLHRELLDGDETRLRLTAKQVFEKPFTAITGLAEELMPGCDPHLLAISLAGLILFHFETAPVRPFLPGVRPEHDDPSIIADHVTSLLSRAMGIASS